MSGRSSVRRHDGDRAQTGIDFLVAMSVFLIAVGFVFAFVPSMFAPFGGSGVNDALIADRSAAYLAEYALVENPANPGVLSMPCTAAFFDVEEEIAASCNFSDEGRNDLSSIIGIKKWNNVQITVGEPDVLNENITMQRGDEPASGSDTVSQRVVSIDGELYELRVRVWS